MIHYGLLWRDKCEEVERKEGQQMLQDRTGVMPKAIQKGRGALGEGGQGMSGKVHALQFARGPRGHTWYEKMSPRMKRNVEPRTMGARNFRSDRVRPGTT